MKPNGVNPDNLKKMMQQAAQAQIIEAQRVQQAQRLANVAMALIQNFSLDPDNGISALVQVVVGVTASTVDHDEADPLVPRSKEATKARFLQGMAKAFDEQVSLQGKMLRQMKAQEADQGFDPEASTRSLEVVPPAEEAEEGPASA